MIAQIGQMAGMVARGDLAAVASRTPAIDEAQGRLSESTGPCVAIAMSRIDPIAETLRGTEFAAEAEVSKLAHASVVCATVAKGRIVDIDVGAAWRVKGVVSILTHQNLPDIVDDEASADETLPTGSHFRLLHDNEVVFKGQPLAVVVARTPEIARAAASLVRVEYERFQGPDVQGEPAIDGDDPIELGESTALFESPFKISIKDTIRGTQGLRQYFRERFGSGLRPQFQAIIAARAALALQCSVRVVLTLQQMRDLARAPRQAYRAR